MMAKEPEHRYQTPQEVADAISPFCESDAASTMGGSPALTRVDQNGSGNLKEDSTKPSQAFPTSPPDHRPKEPMNLGFVIIGVLFLLIGVGAFFALSGDNSKAQEENPPAHVSSHSSERKEDGHGKNAQKRFINSLGMQFVLVPAGRFWMAGGTLMEKEVTIEQPFYLGIHEVTQGEWEAVMGTNPSFFSRTGDGKETIEKLSDEDLKRFPVESVSWDDVQEFIKRLNEREKAKTGVYRLPTEAEWEYACRGGPVSRQDSSFGFYFERPTNDLLPRQANFQQSNLGRPIMVGSYAPNALGLYDMHGNVYEWCQDEVNSQRAIRGGSFTAEANRCRAESRQYRFERSQHQQFGFRLAVSAVSKSDE